MSKKYIIEIEEEPVTKNGVELWKACGFNALVFDQNGLDKLTEFDANKYDFDEVYDEAYKNGLDDAWKAAKKLVWETCIEDLETMGFLKKDETCESGKVLEKYTTSEAILNLKEYEQRQKDIQVGDEVECIDGVKCVVLDETETEGVWHILTENGCIKRANKRLLTNKTGRHFPEIAQVLKRMREQE